MQLMRSNKTMQAKFYLSILQDSQSVKELKELILTSEPDAKINVNSQAKTVEIEFEASSETFDELIAAAGYSIDKVEQQD